MTSKSNQVKKSVKINILRKKLRDESLNLSDHSFKLFLNSNQSLVGTSFALNKLEIPSVDI
jgi:hypothetical protein